MANSCVLRVSGFPLDLGDDELLRDKLSIHFLRHRNGGNGELTVSYPTQERGVASLTFDLKEVAERVLQRSHRLKINKSTYPLEVRRPQVQAAQLSMPIRTFLRLEYFSDRSEVKKLLHRHSLRICREEDSQLYIEGEFQDLSQCRAELYNSLAKLFSSRSNDGKNIISPPAPSQDLPREDFRWKVSGSQSLDSGYSGAPNTDSHSRPPLSSELDPSAKLSPKAKLSPEDVHSDPDMTKSISRQPLDTSTHYLTSNPRKTNNKSAEDVYSHPDITKSISREINDRSTYSLTSNPRNPNNELSEDVYSDPDMTKSISRQPVDKSTHYLMSNPRKTNNKLSEDVYSNPDMTKSISREHNDRSTHSLTSNPRKTKILSTEDVHSNPGLIKGISRQPMETTHNLTSIHEKSNISEHVSSIVKYPKPPAVQPSTHLYRKPSFTSDSTSEQSRRPDGVSPVTFDGTLTCKSAIDSHPVYNHQRRLKDLSAQDVSSKPENPQPVIKEKLPNDLSTKNATTYSKLKETSTGGFIADPKLKETSTGGFTSDPKLKETSTGGFTSDSIKAKSATRTQETSNSSPRQPPDLSGTSGSDFNASILSKTHPSKESLITEFPVGLEVFLYVKRFEGERIENCLHQFNVEMKTENCEGVTKLLLRAKSVDHPEHFYKACREIAELFDNYQKILCMHTISFPDNLLWSREQVTALPEYLSNRRIWSSQIDNLLYLIGPASEVSDFKQKWMEIKGDAAGQGAQNRGVEPQWGSSREPSSGGAGRKPEGNNRHGKKKTSNNPHRPWK